MKTRTKSVLESMVGMFLLLSAAVSALAQSSFQGVFLHPTAPDMQAMGGNFSLTLNGNQATFQSTLFDLYVTGLSLEPVIVVQGSAFPIAFGSGTPGVWPLEEFLGPIPGMTPIELPSGPYLPSPTIYASGVRFTGAWVVPDGWESALLAGDGQVRLQIHGTITLGGSLLQNPLFTATLMPVPEPSTWALLAAGAILFLWYGQRRRVAITAWSGREPAVQPSLCSLLGSGRF
jgi:PEP-CTERM motif